MNSSKSKTGLFGFMKAQASAGKLISKRQSGILSAHRYVSPRGRSLTHQQSEIRRIAYALKIPTPESVESAGRAMAALLSKAEKTSTPLVLIPVPTSTGNIEPNRQLANEIAAEIQRRQPAEFPSRDAKNKTSSKSAGTPSAINASRIFRCSRLSAVASAGSVNTRSAAYSGNKASRSRNTCGVNRCNAAPLEKQRFVYPIGALLSI